MNMIKLELMLKDFFMEDIGDGDLSGESIFSNDERGSFSLIAKESGIFCGKSIIETGFKLMDSTCETKVFLRDGEFVDKSQVIAEIHGTMEGLLKAERVVLNLIQRMSGISTLTNKAVQLTEGTKAKVCDTRKTTPGIRMLEKYAVRCGGGFNHRMGLYDAVMLKDNHIAFAGGITNAVQKVRQSVGHTVKIEVEIESKEQMLEAIEAGADIIMFDNREPSEIQSWISHVPSHIVTEASGGISFENLRSYAESGVEWISLGYLTHSYKALDISAKVLNNGSKGE
ncbi:nicotinate-nucleotide pyrophosphorylase (carboxylating) [Oikeobacillus pervagus]|uniref:Probable nicotinate-nucleotide pyrophosphorylase [carboxylating] n=1 Tax=Oikeobacillus pervagus TaxID=1325931 RepID=A0AAJ1SZM2_9BACI|nr:carboxylating nicotinate-nucleotide diphosphorylase [Oikeobacillus pervagus]MDQ0214572.1 nicotinate-nucleotide pyrophosphorylase (carboxylating) [Oikeobacillus pervagus]